MKFEASNTDTALRREASLVIRVVCDHCTGTCLRPARISTAFWRDEGLVVIRNIPAMICPDCNEEYVDDLVIIELDHLRDQRFAGMTVLGRMLVPILEFGTRQPPDEPAPSGRK